MKGSHVYKSPTEAQVVSDLIKFLEKRGWRTVRHESGFVPGAGSFGEKGICDYQFIRYSDSDRLPGAALVMWIETKAPNARQYCRCEEAYRDERGKHHRKKVCRSCGQKRWQAAVVSSDRGSVHAVDAMVVYRETVREVYGRRVVQGAASGEVDR